MRVARPLPYEGIINGEPVAIDVAVGIDIGRRSNDVAIFRILDSHALEMRIEDLERIIERAKEVRENIEGG